MGRKRCKIRDIACFKMLDFRKVTIILVFCVTNLVKSEDLVENCDKNSWSEMYTCCFHKSKSRDDFKFCTLENEAKDFECLVLEPTNFFSNENFLPINCSIDYWIQDTYCYNLTYGSNDPDFWWICHTSQNISESQFEVLPEIIPSIMETEDDEFDLVVKITDGYPKPAITLNDQWPEFINQSTSVFKIKFNNDNESSDFELKIKQPGFTCNEGCPYMNFTIHYQNGNNEDETSIGIILGVLIPLCFFLGWIGVTIYWYQKKMFCFKSKLPNHPPTHFASSIRAPENVYQRSNNGYIDDSNFTEIDLTDSQPTPMVSYIESVTAR